MQAARGQTAIDSLSPPCGQYGWHADTAPEHRKSGLAFLFFKSLLNDSAS